MKEKIIMLFSDSTYDCFEDEKYINDSIKNHWWSFPLDIKGDPRRKVRIIRVNENVITELKGI